MNRQEKDIVSLLLNEMAFEGAMKHFKVGPPELSRALFDEIKEIGIPRWYDGTTESYVYADIDFDDGKSVFENCYKCLRILRNNIIHANKAYKPDTPKRLRELLDWSQKFIQSVYETEGEFAAQAIEIKTVMRIESF